MFIKLTEKEAPSYDALEISLYPQYFESLDEVKTKKILDYVKQVAMESHFKTKYS